MSNDLETTRAVPDAGPVGGGPSRRAVLTGAGALGATVVLAACGTDAAETTPAPAGAGATTQPAATGGATGEPSGGADAGGSATALAKKADVPVGGALIISAKKLVVTQPTAGDFKAFSAICTHQGCPVSKVDGDVIVCTCHNSRFSIEDGSVKGGPAKGPLKEASIKVDGDDIVSA